MGLCFVITLVF